MSERGDWLGWVMALGTGGLAVAALAATHERATVLVASAVLALVVNERRRGKVLTAKTVRIVDSKGAVRALIGYAGDGIQIGMRAEPLYNNAISPALLWDSVPSVSFTFGSQQSLLSYGKTEHQPALKGTGYAEGMYKNYAAVLDFIPSWSEIEAELREEQDM